MKMKNNVISVHSVLSLYFDMLYRIVGRQRESEKGVLVSVLQRETE